MAEQENPNAPDQEGPNLSLTGAQEPEPEGSKKMLIIIIAGVVLLIAIIAVIISLLFLTGDDNKGVSGTEEEAEFVAEYNRRMQASLEPIDTPIYSDPYPYTVNMKNGRNYVHLSLRVVLKDPLAKIFLDARKPEIDDKIITLLKGKFPEELKTRAGIELLKQAIYLEFNLLFSQDFIDQSATKDRNPIKEVLVNEFFIQ